MKTQLDYASMQKEWYDREAPLMNSTGNHRHHDVNPDYRNILLKQLNDNPEKYKDQYALDFGCGQGRNVSNMILWYPDMFKRADGVDISKGNIDFCKINLEREVGDKTKYEFYVNNGVDLSELPDNFYSFIMSTIVFQHICVHETRFSLMSEIFRTLKPGGVFSFQMGFGYGHFNAANYFDNVYDATATNSGHDVRITDAKDLLGDLEKIGFSKATWTIAAPDHDQHPNWIYVEATK